LAEIRSTTAENVSPIGSHTSVSEMGTFGVIARDHSNRVVVFVHKARRAHGAISNRIDHMMALATAYNGSFCFIIKRDL